MIGRVILIDKWEEQSCGGDGQKVWLAKVGLVLSKRGSKSKLSVVILKVLVLLSNECFAKPAGLKAIPTCTLQFTFSLHTHIDIASMAHQTPQYCACEKASFRRNRACFAVRFMPTQPGIRHPGLQLAFLFCICMNSAESAKPCRTTSDVRIHERRCPTPPRPVFQITKVLCAQRLTLTKVPKLKSCSR